MEAVVVAEAVAVAVVGRLEWKPALFIFVSLAAVTSITAEAGLDNDGDPDDDDNDEDAAGDRNDITANNETTRHHDNDNDDDDDVDD